jgi:23S rRNA (uracil1939-C5)-methyltransferase
MKSCALLPTSIGSSSTAAQGPGFGPSLLSAGRAAPLYTLPEFSLELDFRPTDFTQVNHAVNRILVRRAWACSIRSRASGSPTCSAAWAISRCPLPVPGPAWWGRRQPRPGQAGGKAPANGLGERVEFGVANLFECTDASLAKLGRLTRC